MGALSTCCRIYIVICNIFFVLLGLIFFALGLFIRFGSSVYDSYIDGVKKDIEKSAGDSGFGTLDLSDFDLSSVLLGLALAFIFFGLFILVISFLGCCGACYKIKVLLVVYVIICSVLLIGQAVLVGIVYGSPGTIQDPIKDNLKDSIKSDYRGLNGTNTVSIGWNIVMQKAKCCGVDKYTDFTGASNWITVYTAHTLQTPLACCKTLPSSTDYSCASSPTETNNYLNTGCFDEIWDDTVGNTTIAIPVLAGIGVFQILLILFGIVLSCTWKTNKTGPDDKQRPPSVDRVRSIPREAGQKRIKKKALNF